MKAMTENEIKQKQSSRIKARIIIAIATGIVCQLLLDWQWLFIIISIYCIVESIFLFSIIRKTQLLKAELENHGKNLSQHERMEITGQAIGYAIPLTFVQFILSFLTLSIIGTISKFVTSMF